jgi:hypothetical protein
MFFELRQYRIMSGQRERWVKLMEEEIIPFQISKGMVVVGSFVGQEEEDLYIWIRRFESEEERERLYEEVYESTGRTKFVPKLTRCSTERRCKLLGLKQPPNRSFSSILRS